jgi:archaellum component FlaF (FlaF/FlaG flagellin family)
VRRSFLGAIDSLLIASVRNAFSGPRKKKSGFSNTLSAVILLAVVAVLGSVVVIWGNTTFDAQRKQAATIYENNSNLLRETLVVEDVWFAKTPANHVNLTLRNIGDITVKIKEIKLVVLNPFGVPVGCVGAQANCTRTVTEPFISSNTIGLIDSEQTLRIDVDKIDWDHIQGKMLDITITTDRGSTKNIIWDITLGSQTAGPVIFSALTTNTCPMANNAITVNCLISPALNDTTKTILIFQATSNDERPDEQLVRCFIASTITITCERYAQYGSSTSPINIRWYTLEYSYGVFVQHLLPACNVDGDQDQTITNVSIQSVSMPYTFTLLSSQRHANWLDGDDIRMVRLISSTNAQIRFAPEDSCQQSGPVQNALQVVQHNGVSVTRGLSGIMDGTSLTLSGLPSVNMSRTVLFWSWRTDPPQADRDICARTVRGEMLSSTSIRFTRGCEDPESTDIDDISWERVEFTDGTTVQQVIVSMTPGQGTANVAINPVNTTNTVVFSGGQWTGGQALGEGTYAANDIIGTVEGRFSLTSSTNLQVIRDNTSESATWTAYVVQLP